MSILPFPSSSARKRSPLVLRCALVSALACISVVGKPPVYAQSGITLVQHISRDAGTVTSSTLAFAANNTAGNWIGVAIRAGRTGQAFVVSDSRGNTYRSAVQFNVTVDTPAGDTLAIFYAENVSGGANTITVSQSTSTTLRFAILEYRGIATSNSLDRAIAAQGTSTAPDSGTVTTTAAGDLLLGAIVTANGASPTAGSGYTAEDRVPAAPGTKLFIEDRIQATAGTAAANASLSASDRWASALTAFKAATGTPGPIITSLTPASGVVGTVVTIAGANFGTTVGSSSIRFNGTAATSSTWSASSLVVPVPAGATTGNVVVTVGGQPSNGMSFSVTSASDTQAPTPPGNPLATAGSSSQITLTWTASTDNVGVTGYRVERCQGPSCSTFAQVATPTGTTFSDVGLAASTSYSYRVRAADAAANLSAYSSTANATTPSSSDTQAPTAPASLTATAVGGSQINLNWTASTDNVGVTSYRVEQCLGAGCTTFTEIGTVAGGEGHPPDRSPHPPIPTTSRTRAALRSS